MGRRVASEAWFGSLVWTGGVGLVFEGPIGLAAEETVGGIMTYEIEKHMWKTLLDVVKKDRFNLLSIRLIITITAVDNPS